MRFLYATFFRQDRLLHRRSGRLPTEGWREKQATASPSAAPGLLQPGATLFPFCQYRQTVAGAWLYVPRLAQARLRRSIVPKVPRGGIVFCTHGRDYPSTAARSPVEPVLRRPVASMAAPVAPASATFCRTSSG